MTGPVQSSELIEKGDTRMLLLTMFQLAKRLYRNLATGAPLHGCFD